MEAALDRVLRLRRDRPGLVPLRLPHLVIDYVLRLNPPGADPRSAWIVVCRLTANRAVRPSVGVLRSLSQHLKARNETCLLMELLFTLSHSHKSARRVCAQKFDVQRRVQPF